MATHLLRATISAPRMSWRAKLVWDEANLRAYLNDSQAEVPGNRLPLAGYHEEKDIVA
jgi:cytochrome c2